MGLYHFRSSLRRTALWWLVWLVLMLAACAPPQVSQARINVSVHADGQTMEVRLPAGSSAEDALIAAGIVPGNLDRAEPPLFTILNDGSSVVLVRVQEEYTVEQEIIPFEYRIVRNDSLPEGEEYWLQLGKNGLKEITIRHVYEDGQEVSSSSVNEVILQEPLPQIKMIGVQRPFAPIPIPGRLAYLLNGNAWVMEGSTGERRQVVTSGDLDARIFTLSEDGNWLLYTRRSQDEGQINTLWAERIDGEAGKPVQFEPGNVIHSAAWKPGSTLTIDFSTVEPRAAAPGWQANNEVQQISFSTSGFMNPVRQLLDVNQGGVYGWWGTNFAWDPAGLRLAYTRPDGIGLVDLQTSTQQSLLDVVPLQTFGDWAWVPGLSWGPDGAILFTVTHLPPEDSTEFSLVGVPVNGGAPITLVPQVGMFAYPTPSPMQTMPSGETAYQIAYLQALSPALLENSRYQLVVMDRDGSNRHTLFPVKGAGLEPQRVVWSPAPLQDRSGYVIAVIYQDNVWLIDAQTGIATQVTGDGLTSQIDWR